MKISHISSQISRYHSVMKIKNKILKGECRTWIFSLGPFSKKVMDTPLVRWKWFVTNTVFRLQTIPVAMAGLRNAHGLCPPEVLRFLLDLLKYNDNNKNRFSDNYYRAALIDALSATVTPVISIVNQGWVFEYQ